MIIDIQKHKKPLIITAAVSLGVVCIVGLTAMISSIYKGRPHTMTVSLKTWEYEVAIQQLLPVEEKSWYLPKDAYNVETKREIKGYETYKVDDTTYTKPVYATRYYYTINKWCDSRSVVTTGYDEDPYFGDYILKEGEEDGTLSERVSGMFEIYSVHGHERDNDRLASIIISKEAWTDIKVGDKISYMDSVIIGVYDVTIMSDE